MSLVSMLGSRNRVRVLRVLFARDDLSGRQIARLASMSPSTCKAALDELLSAQVVLRTREPGRNLFEINRSHYFTPTLSQLFHRESQIPACIAAVVRQHLRAADPFRSLAAMGLSVDKVLSVAVRPTTPSLHLGNTQLEGYLRFTFGFRLHPLSLPPEAIPARERIWSTARAAEDATTDRERALRFFGLPPSARTEGGTPRPTGPREEDQ